MTDLVSPPTLGRQLTRPMDALGDSGHLAPPPGTPKIATDQGSDRVVVKMQPTHPGVTLKFKYGVQTDIGGGATNQDAADVFEVKEQNAIVFGVYDGHGRELGELASQVVRDSIRASLMEPGVMGRIRVDAEDELVAVFKKAHEAIRTQFRSFYQSSGMEVQDTPDGYLIKRKNPSEAWTCTHGGTTCTVVIILDGWRMIVANVGDSTALWGGVDPEGQVIFRELSAEHSPESIEEFERVRKFRPSPTDSKQSEMRFVYDAPSYSKAQCPPIFDLNPNTGAIKVTGHGRYYKNVRSEWATLVTTPSTARFQDALAFTRSLGDLHLHVYGVSCRPTVLEYDLVALHALVAGSPKSPVAPDMMTTLLVCTDGVWDNWKYADIINTTCSKEYTSLSASEPNGQKTADKLIQVNIKRAKEHFGNQADNMTGIICHILY
jgi:serine/threonine protein phosphatase PrpC